MKQRDCDKMMLEIIKSGENEESYQRMAQLLLRMYNENKEIYCLMAILDPFQKRMVHLLYDRDGERSVASGSSVENASFALRKYTTEYLSYFNSKGYYGINIMGVYCRTVLNNLYYQKNIASITFDEYTNHCFILPKEYICELIKDSPYLKVPDNFENLKKAGKTGKAVND